MHHEEFFGGALSAGEVRAGCTAYGQWRSFQLAFPGAAESVLLLNMSGAVSGMLAREGAPPTEGTYTVRSAAGRPRAVGLTRG